MADEERKKDGGERWRRNTRKSVGDLPSGDVEQLKLIPQRLADEKMAKEAELELARFKTDTYGNNAHHSKSSEELSLLEENATCATDTVKLSAAYFDQGIAAEEDVWKSPEKTTSKYLSKPRRRQSTVGVQDKKDENYLMPMLKAYYKVGDADLSESKKYTSPKKLLEREALRFHSQVQAELNRIWEWADMDKSGSIDMQEFFRMYNVLYQVVNKTEELPDDIETLAMTEFLTDSGGNNELSKDGFCQSFLQLADTWTAEISANSCK